VARWVHELQRDAPDATIGVVLRDMAADRYSLEYLLRREFGCPGGSFGSLPVNFSTGITLDRAPLARDALGVLQLASGGLPLHELLGLLQSRFLQLPDSASPGVIAFIEGVMLNTRANALSLQALAAQARRCGDDATGEALDERFTALGRDLPRGQRLPPSRWADRFGGLLANWGWPGSGLDSLEFQQLGAWESALDEFAACDAISGRLDLGGAVALLRRCLRNQVSQPESAASRIQVLGPLEAAGLDFDYLWIVGLQADEWPSPARPNPFIPLSLQRERDMPHASPQREWSYAQGLLAQYQRHARELRASYSAHTDGQPRRPSALVKEWPRVDPVRAREIDPGWSTARDAVPLEVIADHHGPAITRADDPPVTGGSGLLRDQSQCPFRAFALHRLGAEPLPEPGDVPGAAERGSLLHDALHHLFTDLRDSDALQAATDAELRQRVALAVDRALAGGPQAPAPPISEAWQGLERDRLQRLLRAWLALESERPAFAIASLEEARTLTVAGLTLRLRVDRIDVLPDGSTVIIDYKTGNCSPRDWLGDRMADPQLPLYSLTAEQTPAALAFARVRSDDCGYAGLGAVAAADGIKTQLDKALPGSPEASDWTALNRHWSAQLSALAEEFMSGLAVVQPRQGACQWCRLQPACRIGSAEEGDQ
jgi:probable DNA repair protein